MPIIPDYMIPPPPARPGNSTDELVWEYWSRGCKLGKREGLEQGRKEVHTEYAEKSRRGFLKDVFVNVGTGAGVLGTLYGIGLGFGWIVDRRNKIREENKITKKNLKEIDDW